MMSRFLGRSGLMDEPRPRDMNALVGRIEQAVSVTEMTQNFSARLKAITHGEVDQLVIVEHDQARAVLMSVDAFQAMRDEIRDVRAECCAAGRSAALCDAKLMSIEDMEARFE
jgi:antitoxin StbD